MIEKNFEESARLYVLKDFKDRLKQLREDYRYVENKINNLCDNLDNTSLNEDLIKDATVHLSIHFTELDIIRKKIKEISEIIDILTTEFTNNN